METFWFFWLRFRLRFFFFFFFKCRPPLLKGHRRFWVVVHNLDPTMKIIGTIIRYNFWWSHQRCQKRQKVVEKLSKTLSSGNDYVHINNILILLLVCSTYDFQCVITQPRPLPPRDTQQGFIRRGSTPRSNLTILYIIFDRKGTLFV